MQKTNYNREKAIEYSHKWALDRNPAFYDFENIGGDCTNFVSQCIYAGAGRMNYTPTYGWYYNNLKNRSPAWTSVNSLNEFILNNKSVGPYGHICTINDLEPGDIITIATEKDYFHHFVFVQDVKSKSLSDIFIACHSMDATMRSLSDYDLKKYRFIHIDNVR